MIPLRRFWRSMILRSLNPVKSRKRRRGARSLVVESLERREVLSASSFNINSIQRWLANLSHKYNVTMCANNV